MHGLIDGGHIGGVGDIHDQGDFRLKAVGDLARAKQAHFLHDVRDRAHFRAEALLSAPQQAQGFGDGEGANPIVKSAGNGEVVTEQFERIRQGDGIADSDQAEGFLAGAGPDVDEQIVDFGQLAVLVGFGQVRGDIADDTADGAGAGMDDDALGLGDGRVNAAEAPDIEVALLIHVVDRHRDLIGVSGEHDPGRTALVEHRHTIAVGVGIGVVRVLGHVIEPDPLAAMFVAGRTWGIEQMLEEGQRWFAHGVGG